MSYEQWYAQANEIAGICYGVDLADLPDQPYRDYYDAGMSPDEAVCQVAGDMDLEFLTGEDEDPEEWSIDLEFEETAGEAFDYFDRFDWEG